MYDISIHFHLYLNLIEKIEGLNQDVPKIEGSYSVTLLPCKNLVSFSLQFNFTSYTIMCSTTLGIC